MEENKPISFSHSIIRKILINQCTDSWGIQFSDKATGSMLAGLMVDGWHKIHLRKCRSRIVPSVSWSLYKPNNSNSSLSIAMVSHLCWEKRVSNSKDLLHGDIHQDMWF